MPKPSGLPTPRPPTTTIRASSSDACRARLRDALDDRCRGRRRAIGRACLDAAGCCRRCGLDRVRADGDDPRLPGEHAPRDRLGPEDDRLDLRARPAPGHPARVREEAPAEEPDQRAGEVATVRRRPDEDVGDAFAGEPLDLCGGVWRPDLRRDRRGRHGDHAREIRGELVRGGVRRGVDDESNGAPARRVRELAREGGDLGREPGQGAVRDLGDDQDDGRHQMSLRSARKSAISRAASSGGAFDDASGGTCGGLVGGHDPGRPGAASGDVRVGQVRERPSARSPVSARP